MFKKLDEITLSKCWAKPQTGLVVGITIVSPSTTTFDAQSTKDPLIPDFWRNFPRITPHSVKVTIGLLCRDHDGNLKAWSRPH